MAGGCGGDTASVVSFEDDDDGDVVVAATVVGCDGACQLKLLAPVPDDSADREAVLFHALLLPMVRPVERAVLTVNMVVVFLDCLIYE